MSLWYNPDIRLPKRDKESPECSIDVIVTDINDNVFCGYIVYKNNQWWYTAPDGTSNKAPYQISYWMYIPTIDSANTLPLIDGE